MISEKSLQADPGKVRAVLEMPSPTDAASERRFIGFTNYLSKLLPRPSNALDWHTWQCCPTSETVGHKCTCPQNFRLNTGLTLQCDASDEGLGAILLQKDQPIASANRSLTDAESRYAQMEKELWAILYGLERFHTYTYIYSWEVIWNQTTSL